MKCYVMLCCNKNPVVIPMQWTFPLARQTSLWMLCVATAWHSRMASIHQQYQVCDDGSSDSTCHNSERMIVDGMGGWEIESWGEGSQRVNGWGERGWLIEKLGQGGWWLEGWGGISQWGHEGDGWKDEDRDDDSFKSDESERDCFKNEDSKVDMLRV